MSAVAAGVLATSLLGGTALAQTRADAEAALARMGLTGNENITYGGAEWSGGRYILTDVVIRDPEGDSDEAAEAAGAADARTGDGGKGPKDPDNGPEMDVEMDFDEVLIDRLIFDALRIEQDRIVLDGFALEGVFAADPSGEGSMRIAHFGVVQPNEVFIDDLVRAFSGEDRPEQVDWDDYRFESFDVEGVNIAGEDENGLTTIGIEQFTMQNYSDIELGQVALRGLTISAMDESGAPGMIRVGELSMTGFKTEAYADLMETIAGGGDQNAIMTAYYRSAFTPQLDLFDRFAMRDILFDMEGVRFALDNMTGQISQAGSRYVSAMELDSARLVPDAALSGGAQLATALGMLGYEDLEFSMAMNSVYDETTGRVQTVGDNYIEMRDGLRIEFVQDFGGYDEYFARLPVLAESMPDNMADEDAQNALVRQLLAPIVLNNMTVRLIDMSLLDRALDAGAAAQGITKEELRVQAGAMVGMGLMAAPPEVPRPLLAQLSAALTNFVNQGGSLVIEAAPPEPLSVGTMMESVEAGAFDYSALGLTFTAEAPE
jgi:hypothetical protein